MSTTQKGGWVYFMANRPNGTLYIGVTSDLVRRIWEHKQGTASAFTRKYYVKRLVYFERHEEIETAIQRETSMKRWERQWKVNLITEQNPEWKDLYEEIL